MDDYIKAIVDEVLKRCKALNTYALLIIPAVNTHMIQGIKAFIESADQGLYFDIVTPKMFPVELTHHLQKHNLWLKNQYVNVDQVELNRYSKLYLIDLQPELLKEIVTIQPRSTSGQLIIDALVTNKKIQILSGFYWTQVTHTAFMNFFDDDIRQLKSWGVVMPDQTDNMVYLDDRLITVSKLMGHEGKKVMLVKGAVMTSMAKDYSQKSNISIIV